MLEFLAIMPADQEQTFAHILDLVIASEELREFSGTELQDKISIRLDGANAISLSNGDAATLERLSASPVGPFHPDLILNPADEAQDTPGATKADAFTIAIAVEGFLINGINTLEIEVADQRDGFLDTALLLGTTDGTVAITPTAPPKASFELLEDTALSGDIALPAGFTPANVEVVTGGGVDLGELVLNNDGSFIYTPDANEFGEDGFIFRATDAGGAPSHRALAISMLSAPSTRPLPVMMNLTFRKARSLMGISSLTMDQAQTAIQIAIQSGSSQLKAVRKTLGPR